MEDKLLRNNENESTLAKKDNTKQETAEKSPLKYEEHSGSYFEKV